MTIFRKLGAFLFPAAAMSLSAFGLTAGAAEPSADPDTLPMQCQISITKDRFGHTYAGILSAEKTVSGYYQLNLEKRGGGSAMISQSGAFHVKAGRTQTLGQAMFGGLPPQDVDAQLILHVDGKKIVCGSQAEI